MVQTHYEQEHFDQVLEFYQSTDYNPNRDKLQTRVNDAYPILKETAANRDLIEYKPLAKKIGTDERRYLSVVLGAISRIEVKEERPPLSCVAVQAGPQIPNEPFFELIDSLNYDVPGKSNEEAFEMIRDELQNRWNGY